MTTAWRLLQDRVRTAAGSPLVTHVDGAAGTRVELSARSVENAAAKIANALRDDFDLAAGSSVALALPLHWQRAAWCAGVWTAGCVVVLDDDPGPVDLVVSDLGRVPGLVGAGAEIAIVSLHPLGLPLDGPLPAGLADVTLAVRRQPDAYLFDPPTAGLPALRWAGAQFTQAGVLDLAGRRAQAWGLGPDGRLLATDELDRLDGWLAALAVPLAAHAAVVLADRAADPEHLAQTEHITSRATSGR